MQMIVLRNHEICKVLQNQDALMLKKDAGNATNLFLLDSGFP